MHPRRVLLAFAGAAALLFIGDATRLRAEDRGSGQQVSVEVYHGPVLVHGAPFQVPGRGKPLTRGVHLVPAGKWLHAGSAAKGKPAPRYKVLLPSGARLVKGPEWVALTPMTADVAAAYRRMLAQVTRPAGRLKGPPVAVRFWQPSPYGKTWAPAFQVRWAPVKRALVTLRLTGGEPPVELWSAAGVSGPDGGLTDPSSARAAVVRALVEGKLPVRLELEAPGAREGFELRLAGPETEPELARELAWWDRHTSGTVRLLGQGAALQQKGYLGAAAELFLQAWREDPESALLGATLRNSLGLLGLEDREIAAVLAGRPAG